MLFAPILVVLLSSSSAVRGHPLDKSNFKRAPSFTHGRSCGTFITPEEVAAQEKHFSSHRMALGRLNSTALNATINVHFHVISKDETPAGGNVFDDQIEAQIKVMNDDYKTTGLSWKLVNTTRTQNLTWFSQAGPETDAQKEMKEGLRLGGPETLNVYSVGFTNLSAELTGLLGFATFPRSYEKAPKDDGVVIRYSSMPGGESAPFDLGRTLTHETGHWLGLYHTFQGGCEGTGDVVSDTPAEAEPNFKCETRNTCDGAGEDPIHNFMNYSPDACLAEFTPGQTTRIRAQIQTYRKIA